MSNFETLEGPDYNLHHFTGEYDFFYVPAEKARDRILETDTVVAEELESDEEALIEEVRMRLYDIAFLPRHDDIILRGIAGWLFEAKHRQDPREEKSMYFALQVRDYLIRKVFGYADTLFILHGVIPEHEHAEIMWKQFKGTISEEEEEELKSTLFYHLEDEGDYVEEVRQYLKNRTQIE